MERKGPTDLNWAVSALGFALGSCCFVCIGNLAGAVFLLAASAYSASRIKQDRGGQR